MILAVAVTITGLNPSQQQQQNEKAREFQKNIYFCFIDYAKAFDCVHHNKLWKILRDGNTRPPDLPLWETCMQVRKQQLELDMEQQTGSK